MITTSSNFTAVNYFIPILIIAKTQKATIKITSQAENRTLILRLGYGAANKPFKLNEERESYLTIRIDGSSFFLRKNHLNASDLSSSPVSASKNER
jgi:hypothetical protein